MALCLYSEIMCEMFCSAVRSLRYITYSLVARFEYATWLAKIILSMRLRPVLGGLLRSNVIRPELNQLPREHSQYYCERNIFVVRVQVLRHKSCAAVPVG